MIVNILVEINKKINKQLSRKSNNQHGVDPIDLKYYCMSNVTDTTNFTTLSLPTNMSQVIKRPFKLGLSMKLSRPNPNRKGFGWVRRIFGSGLGLGLKVSVLT